MEPNEKKTPQTGRPFQGSERAKSLLERQFNIFPSTLQELDSLKINALNEKYRNVPGHAIPKPKKAKDSTANELTRAIIEAITLCGGQAERIANTGRFLDQRQKVKNVLGHEKTIGSFKYIPGGGTNGTADISATFKGISIKIEVKIGKDKLSQAQKEYGHKVEQAGGVYIVARSFSQVMEELKRRVKDGK